MNANMVKIKLTKACSYWVDKTSSHRFLFNPMFIVIYNCVTFSLLYEYSPIASTILVVMIARV
jgi:hypothetical protein